jgi:hypothetical protein
MNRIREVLLTQYIGAIAIGLVLAQGIFVFVNSLVQAVATFWALQQARGVLTESAPFSWHNLIASMITVVFYFLICLSLIRWLYSESTNGKGDSLETQEP